MGITGSDLNAALAATSDEQPQSNVDGTVTRGGASISYRSAPGANTTWMTGGEGELATRQANFDSTIGRPMEELRQRVHERYLDEDGFVRPGFEREVRNAELQFESFQEAARYAKLVADEALDNEEASHAQKLGVLKGEAAKVDQRNVESYVRRGMQDLRINPNKR